MLYSIYNISDTPLLNISTIGTSKDIKRTRFGPGQRNFYCIHYVLRGKGYFNGELVTAGEGFLITPNSYQYYYPDPEDPWEYLWFNSSDPSMEKIFTLYNADSESNIFKFGSTYILNDCVQTVRENHNKIFSPQKLLEMFLHILNNHTDSSEIKGERNFDIYFKYAKSYITSNLHKQITINEITQLLGIGQPYLYKIFKEKTNMSPKQYISIRKLEKAKALLKETELNINEIANSVGYFDQLAFSKFFTNNVGISPKKYRQT